MDTQKLARILHALWTNLTVRETLRQSCTETEEEYLEKKIPAPQRRNDSVPAPPNQTPLKDAKNKVKPIAKVCVAALAVGIVIKIINAFADTFLLMALGNMAIMAFIGLLIPTVMFGYKVFQLNGDYKLKVERYEKLKLERDENKKYNDTEYPRLVAEREAKLPPLRQEYAERMADLQRRLDEVEKLIEVQAPYLPERYHSHADDIAVILEQGRADSIEDAISVLKQDLEEERRLAEERRHQEYLERQARLAETKAKKEAEEAKKQADKALKARQDAAFQRCLNCAHLPIGAAHRCDSRVQEQFRKSGDVCPAYRPK